MLLWIFIGIGALTFFLMLAYFFMGRAKKGTYRTAIEELEIRKYEISNKPVMFELAKLKSVRKSERIVGLVSEWEKRWQDLEEQLATLEDNIAYAEESIATGEFEKADEIVEVTGKDLSDLGQKVDKLLSEIENLKSSEFRNRDGIVKLRESFSQLTDKYKKNKEIYTMLKTEIKGKFEQIEAYFTSFDEHMETSNYDLADEISEKIQEKLDLLHKAFEKMPMYHESIEIDIKPMLDGILDSHGAMLEDGMYLKHLKIESSIVKCKKELDKIPDLLKNFQFEEIEKLLVEIPSEAKKLRDLMKQEIDIKDAFDQDVAQLRIDVAYVVKESENLNHRYDEIKESCLMGSDDEDNFKSLIREIGIVNASVTKLFSEIETRGKATTDLHTSALSYLTQLSEITEQLRIFDEEIVTLGQGSKEIKGKSIELLQDVNELKSDFEKMLTDKSNLDFKLTLEKADAQVQELLKETSKMPLDVSKAKLTLDVATEMLTKARKKVTLIVEQSKMAERLLVYGNRYIDREGVYLMDLTIAEDQFHQGNYENVIDKMYKILTDVEGNAFFKVFEELKQELGCMII